MLLYDFDCTRIVQKKTGKPLSTELHRFKLYQSFKKQSNKFSPIKDKK